MKNQYWVPSIPNELPPHIKELGLDATHYLYIGKPFVGRVNSYCHNSKDPLSSYTIFMPTIPPNQIGGESNLSVKDPKNLLCLARMVFSRYGSDFEDKITFDPPPARLVGRPGHWCVREYYKLEEDLISLIHNSLEV